jgi:hypothetical protein
MKIINKKALSLLSLTLATLALHAGDFARHTGDLPSGPAITQEDVKTAQKTWGDAVVAIGAAGDGATELAEQIAASAYAFAYGPIQFKPTLASEKPFRSDLAGAVSYFVGGNEKFPEDGGFALTPWTNVRFVNDVVLFHENIAIAMGHYYFTNTSGEETKVEYTKGYVKVEEDSVLIFLQDSSLPYQP